MSKRQWVWSAAAAIVLAAAGVTAWVAITNRESPYERCYRVIHDKSSAAQQVAADRLPVDPEVDAVAAKGTCDYLASQGRLAEVTDETAASLISEAAQAGADAMLARLNR